MAQRNKRPIQLTDRQVRFCELVAENEQRHKTERLTRGEVYLNAGYNSKHPDSGAAQEIKKKHIKDEVARVLSTRYGIEPAPEAVQSEQEDAEAELKRWSTQSSQGANNYALYLLKKKEAGVIESTVKRVLLSTFLSEADLDAMGSTAADLPEDVVLAGKKAKAKAGIQAKSPVNIEETA